jgi:hypothetical protein
MIVVSRRFSVFYRHARDLVSPLINDHHRIPMFELPNGSVVHDLVRRAGDISVQVIGNVYDDFALPVMMRRPVCCYAVAVGLTFQNPPPKRN